MKKYYVYQFKENSEIQWEFLKKSALKIADKVSFNPLWPNWYLQDELSLFRDLVKEMPKLNRINQINKFIVLKINDKLREFIESKPFSFWKNYYLEDPSFIKGKTEFISCKSRKEQVIMLLSESERMHLIDKGFDVWFDIDGEMI